MAKKVKKRKTPDSSLPIFQLKITLQGIEPLIWRRIQIQDCTLDKLHEHIQTAMGWTNSHLHHFRINDQLYGDPMVMQESYGGNGLRRFHQHEGERYLARIGEAVSIQVQYDFGDSWEHEILFEGGTCQRNPLSPVSRGPAGLPTRGRGRQLRLRRILGSDKRPGARKTRVLLGMGWAV